MTKAIEQARERIRRGVAPGLAIYQTAHEYGCATHTLAMAVRGRKPDQHHTEPQNAWWQR
jgi:hypothetical protein